MDSANEYGNNFGLRDEIKAYWSARAATFDLSPGHEIFSEEERAAWHRLVEKHLGRGEGKSALDLASGTGVISHLMDDLGYRVTGLDWAEPMLERAKAKAKSRKRAITFRMGDAENTMEPDAAHDVIINRHLVWTLVDPKAAFQEWLRVLKPGGRVLIVDGDFVTVSVLEKLLKSLAAKLLKLGLLKEEPVHMPADMAGTHNSILSRVYFSQGARAEAVAALLRDAGFEDVVVDTDLRAIHKTQAKNWNVLKAAARGIQHRYAVSGRKPG
ncbi:class I SAM-dependent methyltransferase [Agrobacterium rubi]|uniref:Class I SAM-dependent methyltransferase n=1 Tax=Agrobacterium rubi TaxID=28099 RepID=A0AAE7R6P3_9HYPH|nr:class I SAM-dependent methyltransferase [Agrobacterium rubi]NTE88899.1 class I SAM-dependent methyltransferase [Agrobacterium rubi]NTF04727.1 class I SAM-dependent methyltransferase [Agrobacterium rubi]NTF10251.1 class I SAM-dependent methyltransferase [Agrobacterium rubi]NTF21571.1 class I SAM-dependent methyltransferase [Agrobacterium rubi]NTF28428.1 class I SAM-dependent methyltransferase [Agrobacterium rubi]